MTLESPSLKREGDAFIFTWPVIGIGIGFDQLREGRGGLTGEISVHSLQQMPSGANGHITWGLYNLSAPETRQRMARSLAGYTHEGSADDWQQRLEYVCVTTATLYRRGAKTVKLADVNETAQVTYLIERLLPAGHPSILFGEGGAGKGWLVTACGLVVATGQTHFGLTPTRQGAVLYLDYESDIQEARRRVGWLCRGTSIPVPQCFHYREMHRSLVDDAAAVRREISRLGIELVILDSLVPACGDDPNAAEAARAVMDALRSFTPATPLTVAHVTKQASQDRGMKTSVFGSVFFGNLARSTWELRSSDATETDVTVALTNRKANLGAKLPPRAWRLQWQDQQSTATIRPIDNRQASDLIVGASLASRIRAALLNGAKQTDELATELDEPSTHVRAECNRMRDVVNLEEARGRGHSGYWGLKA